MAVVNKEWKYIYWQYEDKRMRATEELFNVGNDRLEMKNLANDKKYAKQLKQMQKLYDKHFKILAQNAVDFNNYKKYEVLFDRKSTREEKTPHLVGTYEQQEAERKAKKKN